MIVDRVSGVECAERVGKKGVQTQSQLEGVDCKRRNEKLRQKQYEKAIHDYRKSLKLLSAPGRSGIAGWLRRNGRVEAHAPDAQMSSR